MKKAVIGINQVKGIKLINFYDQLNGFGGDVPKDGGTGGIVDGLAGLRQSRCTPYTAS